MLSFMKSIKKMFLGESRPVIFGPGSIQIHTGSNLIKSPFFSPNIEINNNNILDTAGLGSLIGPSIRDIY